MPPLPGNAGSDQLRLTSAPASSSLVFAASAADWVLPDAPWRHQQVLDLGEPGGWEHLLGRLDALLSRATRSATSSGTTTVTSSTRPIAAGRGCRRRSPATGCSTSCGRASRRWRSRVRVGRRPGGPRDPRRAPTGCGRATPTTRSIARRSSAGRAAGAAGARRRARRPAARAHSPVGRTTCRSALRDRAVLATSGSSGTSAARRRGARRPRRGVAFHKRVRALLHGGEVVRGATTRPGRAGARLVGRPAGAVFAYVQLAAAATRCRADAVPRPRADVRYRVEPVPLAGGPQAPGPAAWLAAAAST